LRGAGGATRCGVRLGRIPALAADDEGPRGRALPLLAALPRPALRRDGARRGGLGVCPESDPERLACVTHCDAASSVAPICLHIGTPCVLASRHVPRASHRSPFPDRPLMTEVVPETRPPDTMHEAIAPDAALARTNMRFAWSLVLLFLLLF